MNQALWLSVTQGGPGPHEKVFQKQSKDIYPHIINSISEYQDKQKTTEHFQTPRKLGDMLEPWDFHIITAYNSEFPYSAKCEDLSLSSQLPIKLQNQPPLSTATAWGLNIIASEEKKRYRRSHRFLKIMSQRKKLKPMEVKGLDSCSKSSIIFIILSNNFSSSLVWVARD